MASRGGQFYDLGAPARSRLPRRAPFSRLTSGSPASIPGLLFSACVANIFFFVHGMGCP